MKGGAALNTVRVVLAGGHCFWAPGVQVVEDDVTGGTAVVAGRTDDPDRIDALMRRHHPDVVVATDHLPLIRQLAATPARIAVVASHDDTDVALALLRAGAHGLLAPGPDLAALVAPLLAVASGLSVIPAELLATVAGTTMTRDRAALDGLAPDDLELWRMVADGSETAAIAERLFVSERTAKRMVASLLRRLRVANRVQAAALAGQSGLLDDVNPPAR